MSKKKWWLKKKARGHKKGSEGIQASLFEGKRPVHVDEGIKAQVEAASISRSFGVPSDDKKSIHIAIARNGVFEVRENEIGVFTYQLAQVEGKAAILGSTTYKPESVVLKLPKIPSKFLKQIISFFVDVCTEKHGSEALVQVFFNRNTREYFLYVCEQRVSGASVNFDRDKKLESEHLLVMDIHSHNKMNAFWSGTDDADEKETRLYGVIGKLDEKEPAMKFRASVAGKFIDLVEEDIFDAACLKETYPSDWMEKVKYRSSVEFTTRYGSTQSYTEDNREISPYVNYEEWNRRRNEAANFDQEAHELTRFATAKDDADDSDEEAESSLPIATERLSGLNDDVPNEYDSLLGLVGAAPDEMQVRDVADSIRDLNSHQMEHLASILDGEDIIEELYSFVKGK